MKIYMVSLLHRATIKNCQDANVNKRLKQLKQRPELFDLFVKRKSKRVCVRP